VDLSVLGVGLAFSVAGVLQTYLERVPGPGNMLAQAQSLSRRPASIILSLQIRRRE
jgi:hypothetical protein